MKYRIDIIREEQPEEVQLATSICVDSLELFENPNGPLAELASMRGLGRQVCAIIREDVFQLDHKLTARDSVELLRRLGYGDHADMLADALPDEEFVAEVLSGDVTP